MSAKQVLSKQWDSQEISENRLALAAPGFRSQTPKCYYRIIESYQETVGNGLSAPTWIVKVVKFRPGQAHVRLCVFGKDRWEALVKLDETLSVFGVGADQILA